MERIIICIIFVIIIYIAYYFFLKIVNKYYDNEIAKAKKIHDEEIKNIDIRLKHEIDKINKDIDKL